MNTLAPILGLAIALGASAADLKTCNVLWEAPSGAAFDSMPLSGLRGAGANA
jgi:hypothetical protein